MNFQEKLSRIKMIYKYGVHFDKPFLMLRLLKIYFKAAVLRQWPLKYVEFVTDYGCNLRCEHCFAQSLKKPSGTRRMSVEDYGRAAREAMDLGAVDFSFQGGEVMLDPDRLEKIIKVCKPRQNIIAITTNATMWDEARMRRFKKAGVDHLIVSLDSGIAEEHNRFRGVEGTFDKAMNTIKLAKKIGLNVAVNTTLCHANVRSAGLIRLIEFAAENNLLLNTIFGVPAGRWNDKTEIMLSLEDMDYIKELRKKYPIIRRDIDANLVHKGCGAIKESIYISPYGDVLPCPFIHISIGNVLDEPLKKIRERGLGLEYFNHFHEKCLTSEEPEFINKYLSRTFGKNNLPLSFDEGFKD